MSLNISFGAETLTRTPAYLEEMQDDGTVTARATYKVKTGTSISLPAASPRNAYLYYKKHTLQVMEDSGGIWDVYIVFFEGVGPGGTLPTDYGELLVGDARIPIQCHPKFLSDLAGTAVAPTVYAPTARAWSPDDMSFVKFPEYLDSGALNPLRGVDSFESYQATYRWHEFSTTSQWANFAYIDKIYAGVTGGPSTPSGRSWKLSGMNIARRGYIYEGTYDYKLSGPLGWITTPPVYAS